MISAEQKFDAIELLIADLQVAKNSAQSIALIENINLQLEDVQAYHYFGVKSYGRNLIFSCDEFEVILMCWRPGQRSVAHDHNGSLCVMKCLAGTLDEQRFHKSAGAITPIGKYQLASGSTASITDEQGIHSIGNESLENACSMHFYFPPIHHSNLYDLDNAQPRPVQSAFTSQYRIILDSAVESRSKHKLLMPLENQKIFSSPIR